MDGSLMFAKNAKNQISSISKSRMQTIIFKLNITKSKKSPSQFLKESFSHVRITNRQNWYYTAKSMENSSVRIAWKTTMTMTQKKMSLNTLKLPSSKKFRRLLTELTQKIKNNLNLFKSLKRSSDIKKRPTKMISRLSSKSFNKSKMTIKKFP